MKKQSLVLASVAGVAVMGVFGLSSVFAAESLGTVTGKDGYELEKISMEAEVLSVDGSHTTIKDAQTGKIYQTSFGPSRYSGDYEVGEVVNVEGVVTTANNDNGHDFQTLKLNELELRSEFQAKPNWAGAGSRGEGHGQGKGQRQGGMNGGNGTSSFVDADGDGNCDNRN